MIDDFAQHVVDMFWRNPITPCKSVHCNSTPGHNPCRLSWPAITAGSRQAGSESGAPRRCPDQVIELASRLLRLAVLAPSMVAIATRRPPEVAEIDSVAAFAELVTVR